MTRKTGWRLAALLLLLLLLAAVAGAEAPENSEATEKLAGAVQAAYGFEYPLAAYGFVEALSEETVDGAQMLVLTLTHAYIPERAGVYRAGLSEETGEIAFVTWSYDGELELDTLKKRNMTFAPAYGAVQLQALYDVMRIRSMTPDAFDEALEVERNQPMTTVGWGEMMDASGNLTEMCTIFMLGYEPLTSWLAQEAVRVVLSTYDIPEEMLDGYYAEITYCRAPATDTDAFCIALLPGFDLASRWQYGWFQVSLDCETLLPVETPLFASVSWDASDFFHTAAPLLLSLGKAEHVAKMLDALVLSWYSPAEIALVTDAVIAAGRTPTQVRYLPRDETASPTLTEADAIERARNAMWLEKGYTELLLALFESDATLLRDVEADRTVWTVHFAPSMLQGTLANYYVDIDASTGECVHINDDGGRLSPDEAAGVPAYLEALSEVGEEKDASYLWSEKGFDEMTELWRMHTGTSWYEPPFVPGNEDDYEGVIGIEAAARAALLAVREQEGYDAENPIRYGIASSVDFLENVPGCPAYFVVVIELPENVNVQAGNYYLFLDPYTGEVFHSYYMLSNG